MPKLQILNGTLAGRSVGLVGETVHVGSSPDSHVRLREPGVLPAHLRLEPSNGEYVLHIEGAAKAVTTVNGRRVAIHLLAHGDSIRIGTIELRYDHPAPVAPSASIPAPATLLAASGVPLWKPLAVGGAVFGLLVGGLLVVLLTRRSDEPRPADTADRGAETVVENTSPSPNVVPNAIPKAAGLPTWPRVVGSVPASTGVRSMVRLASAYPTWQAAVDALESGQSLVFDAADKGKDPLAVRKPLVDVQFIGGSARWEWSANLTDCQFFYHDFESLSQTAGKLAHSAFYRCGFHDTHLTHTDTVSFYFDDSRPLRPEETLKSKRPLIHLDGFVRAATFVRPLVSPATAIAHDQILRPAIRIRPTDPVGNGSGSYILGAVVRNQRAWTPFEFAGGENMTLAQSFSEGMEWADPLLESTGRSHAVVSTSFAAKPMLTYNDYNTMPPLLATRWGSEFSHAELKKSPPYRGAAIHLTGFANRLVAHGDGVNTWSVGRQAGLPRLHYVDGVVAVDAAVRQYLSAEVGSLSVNLAESKAAFRMQATKSGTQFQSGDLAGAAVHYPAEGPNLVEPTLVPLGDLRVGPVGWLGSRAMESFAGRTIAEIEAALVAKKAIRLPTGTYTFTKPIRSGLIVGDGMGRTVLKFPKGIDCFEGGAEGATNLTISGGKTGWNPERGRGTVAGEFVRVRFEGQSDAAINLGGATNLAIQDCEFADVETAIANGRLKTTKAGTIHGLNVLNCTFGKTLKSAIELRPDAATQGRIGIHNCRFADSGAHAILIEGGQTHLIQGCEIRSASAQAYVPSILVTSTGTTVFSHVEIDNSAVKSSQNAVSVVGSAVLSHLSLKGSKTSLKVTRAFAADHVAADGTLEGVGESLLCRSKFSAPKLPVGVAILSADGKSVKDVSSQAYELPKVFPAPPEVVFSSKSGKSGRKFTWDAVEDPVSGIVGYAVFSEGKEVGRAALEYEPPGAEHSPFLKPTKVLEYLDPDPNHRGYQVRAINGAGLMSGGLMAQPFALGQPRGIFYKPGGKEEATGYGFIPSGKAQVQLVLPGGAKSQSVSTVGLNGQPNRVRFDRGWLTEDAKQWPKAVAEDGEE